VDILKFKKEKIMNTVDLSVIQRTPLNYNEGFSLRYLFLRKYFNLR